MWVATHADDFKWSIIFQKNKTKIGIGQNFLTLRVIKHILVYVFTLANDKQNGSYFTEAQVHLPEAGTIVLNCLYSLFPIHGMGPYDSKELAMWKDGPCLNFSACFTFCIRVSDKTG